ncbi:MAG: hypothetical protein K2X93_15435, partial [Candidatus Obscuribacterales bacterium]|nr:hypothetical protein [Candidatus Obscuribacterales bacterium]
MSTENTTAFDRTSAPAAAIGSDRLQDEVRQLVALCNKSIQLQSSSDLSFLAGEQPLELVSASDVGEILPAVLARLTDSPPLSQSLPLEGSKENAGKEITNPDGSKVFYATDGRPRRCECKNGCIIEYKYVAAGGLSVSAKLNGTELFSVESTDDGKFEIRSPDGRKLTANSLTICMDGTFYATAPHVSFRPLSGGGVLWDAPGFGGVKIADDGSMITMSTSKDGQLRPTMIEYTGLPRMQANFSYGDGKAITVVVKTGSGATASTIEYHTIDGKTWTRKEVGGRGAVPGELNFNSRNRPEFNLVPEANEIRERPEEKTKNGVERIKLVQKEILQYLPVMYEQRKQAKADELTRKHTQKLGTADKVSAKDFEKALSDLHKDTTDEWKLLDQEKERVEKQLKADAQRSERWTGNSNDLWNACGDTRTQYRKLIEWTENYSSKLFGRLILGEVIVPPNCPFEIPNTNGADFPMSPSLVASMADYEKVRDRFKLPVKAEEPPCAESLRKIGASVAWLVRAEDSLNATSLAFELNTILPAQIRLFNLPERWITEPTDNPEGKRAVVVEMVDLASKLQNYCMAAQSLRLDTVSAHAHPGGDKGNYRRIKLPEGCQIVTAPDGTKSMRFRWPERLSVESPEGQRIISTYKRWLADNGPYIDDCIKNFVEQKSDLAKQLHYGDTPGKVWVRLDPDGKLCEVHPHEQKPADTERLQEANNLSCRVKAERLADGRYVFHSVVQAEQVRDWNYLNWGAKSIGEASNNKLGPIDPDAPVIIRDSDNRIQVVAAKDVEQSLLCQKALHWTTKVTTGLMDSSMLVAGLGSGGAAFVAWQSGKLATRAALRAGLPALGKATIGATGIFNNASVNSTEEGILFNHSRGFAMLGMISRDLGKNFGYFGGLKKSAATLEVEHAAKEGFKNCGWFTYRLLKPVHYVAESKFHEYVMLGTNVAFAPILVKDFSAQLTKAASPKEVRSESNYAKAFDYIKAGRKFNDFNAEKTAPASEQAKRAATLDGYLSLLQSERMPPDPVIENIAKRCAEFSQGAQSPTDKVQDQMRLQDLQRFRDELGSITQFADSHSQRTAAAIALLLLSATTDGSLPTGALATQGISITTDRLSSLLQRGLENQSAAIRLVSSDALLRLGKCTPFGAATVLKQISIEENAPNAVRATAMSQLAQLTNGIRLLETSMISGLDPQQKMYYRARSYGVTSQDLINSFKQLAAGNGDENIRGLAMGIVHDLGATQDACTLTHSLAARSLACAAAIGTLNGESYLSQVKAELKERFFDRTAAVGERVSAITSLENLGAQSPFVTAEDRRTLNRTLIELIGTDKLTSADRSAILQAISLLDTRKPENFDGETREAIRRILSRRDDTEVLPLIKQALLMRAWDPAGARAIFGEHEEAKSAANLVNRLLVFSSGIFAQDHPELRASAIRALTNLPPIARLNEDKSARPDGVLSSLRPPTADGKPFQDFEPDARVRLAAVDSMVARGQENSNALIDAFQRERDFSVSAKLFQIRISTYRPTRDWYYFWQRDGWTASFESAAKHNCEKALPWAEGALKDTLLKNHAVKAGTYKLEVPDRSAVLEWQERIPGAVTYAIFPMKAPDRWEPKKGFGPNPDFAKFKSELTNKILNPAAKAQGEDQRRMLVYLLVHRDDGFTYRNDPKRYKEGNIGFAMSGNPDATKTEINKMLFDSFNSLLAGGQYTGELLHAAVTLLRGTQPLTTEERRELLKTFRKLADSASSEVGTPVESVHRFVLINTLQAAIPEILRDDFRPAGQPLKGSPDWQPRQDFRRELFDFIEAHKFKGAAYLILDSLANCQPGGEAYKLYEPHMKRVKEMLANWRDSVRAIWSSSESDAWEHMDVQQRADNLKEVLGLEAPRIIKLRSGTALPENNGDSYDISLAILRSAKGKPVTSLTDPRVPLIKLALNCDDGTKAQMKAEHGEASLTGNGGAEMVRLAAAQVVLQNTSGFSLADRQKAIAICAELSWQATQYGYQRDAEEMFKEAMPKDKNTALLSLAQIVLVGGKHAQKAHELFKANAPAEADCLDSNLRTPQAVAARYLAFRYVRSEGPDASELLNQLRNLKGEAATEAIRVVAKHYVEGGQVANSVKSTKC